MRSPVAENLEQRLLARLFLDWIASRTGESAVEILVPDEGMYAADLAGKRIYLVVQPVSSGEPPGGWQASLEAFAGRVRPGDSAVLIWLPAGAAVPLQEPRASATFDALQRTIDSLGPGETADARLPITIAIRKRDEAGAYVSAFGGLSPYWAQFTDKVQGYHHVDSTELHRLPDDEAYIKALVERIVDVSKSLSLGEAASVEAEDFWRVQRLVGGEGCAVIGLPPGDESESGAPLRKRLRAAVRGAGEQLVQLSSDGLHVLAVYGHYTTLEGEPVGPALRGQDPSLFAGLDMVALIADGSVKPLIDITRQSVFQPRAG